MRDVFIIGSKGIPSNYGGFETFVEKLTEYNDPKETGIKYHVSCLSDNYEEFEHNNARCFNVKVPNIGPAKAVYYDIAALNEVIKYIESNRIQNAIVYILACRIGPFIGVLKRKLKKSGAVVYVNPDGHEWKRAKWNFLIRKYWKLSERLMVKHADLLVCDSINIEKYIKEDYSKYNPETVYIAYGADVALSAISDNDQIVLEWFSKHNVNFENYYLIVGRFVPENNYETMIKGFMDSKTNKDLVIITNIEKNKFYKDLLDSTKFDKDERIKFVGTVYDQELLKKIREKAYAYIHGHEVGGTNPSLLEALSSTKINLLLDVGFNKEVAEESAMYWKKQNLYKLINKVEMMSSDIVEDYGVKSKKRILDSYSWYIICKKYSEIFEVN